MCSSCDTCYAQESIRRLKRSSWTDLFSSRANRPRAENHYPDEVCTVCQTPAPAAAATPTPASQVAPPVTASTSGSLSAGIHRDCEPRSSSASASTQRTQSPYRSAQTLAASSSSQSLSLDLEREEQLEVGFWQGKTLAIASGCVCAQLAAPSARRAQASPLFRCVAIPREG